MACSCIALLTQGYVRAWYEAPSYVGCLAEQALGSSHCNRGSAHEGCLAKVRLLYAKRNVATIASKRTGADVEALTEGVGGWECAAEGAHECGQDSLLGIFQPLRIKA